MSYPGLDQTIGLEPAVAVSSVADGEGENHIRERLGKYGLKKLFDAGGVSFIAPVSLTTTELTLFQSKLAV